MATESLTSAQIAERLGINAEAAGLVRRHRSRVQSRSGRTRLDKLFARIAALEAELANANEHAGGFRADYERERDRGDRLMAMRDTLVAGLGGLAEGDGSLGGDPGGGHPDVTEPPQRGTRGRRGEWFLRKLKEAA